MLAIPTVAARVITGRTPKLVRAAIASASVIYISLLS